jgi:hypothetical protein
MSVVELRAEAELYVMMPHHMARPRSSAEARGDTWLRDFTRYVARLDDRRASVG